MSVTPRFNYEFNFGHVLTLFGIVISVGGSIAYNIKQNAEMQYRLSSLERNFEARVKQIDADAAARVAVYTPQIQALNKSQDLQDERIANIVSSTQESRRVMQDVAKQVGDMATTLAVIRVQMNGGTRRQVN